MQALHTTSSPPALACPPAAQALLSILDSPLNKSGKVKGIFIRTAKNVIISVNPKVSHCFPPFVNRLHILLKWLPCHLHVWGLGLQSQSALTSWRRQHIRSGCECGSGSVHQLNQLPNRLHNESAAKLLRFSGTCVVFQPKGLTK